MLGTKDSGKEEDQIVVQIWNLTAWYFTMRYRYTFAVFHRVFRHLIVLIHPYKGDPNALRGEQIPDATSQYPWISSKSGQVTSL